MYFVFLPCIAVLKKNMHLVTQTTKIEKSETNSKNFVRGNQEVWFQNLIGNPVTARHIISM